MVELLKNATEGVTGPACNVRGVMGHASRIRAWGTGTAGAWTGDAVTIEGSMTTQGDDWVTVGTIASGGNDITTGLTAPYERLRAKTGATDTAGTSISVYLEMEKELGF